MSTITIPAANWAAALAEAIKTADPGDTILVHGEAAEVLAERAMRRAGRTDLNVRVEVE